MGLGHIQEIKGRYTLTSSPTANGILITKESYELDVVKHEKMKVISPGDTEVQKFINQLTSLSPSFVVNDRGSILSIPKLPEFQKQLEKASIEWAATAADYRIEEVMNTAKTMASESYIKQSINNEWQQWVEQWAGRDVTEGKTYTLTEAHTFDILDYIPVKTKSERTILGNKPCNNDDTDFKCVEIIYKYKILPDQITEANKTFIAKDPLNRKEVRGIEMSYELNLITDPNSLLPYKTQEKTHFAATITLKGKLDKPQIKSIETVTTFKY